MDYRSNITIVGIAIFIALIGCGISKSSLTSEEFKTNQKSIEVEIDFNEYNMFTYKIKNNTEDTLIIGRPFSKYFQLYVLDSKQNQVDKIYLIMQDFRPLIIPPLMIESDSLCLFNPLSRLPVSAKELYLYNDWLDLQSNKIIGFPKSDCIYIKVEEPIIIDRSLVFDENQTTTISVTNNSNKKIKLGKTNEPTIICNILYEGKLLGKEESFIAKQLWLKPDKSINITFSKAKYLELVGMQYGKLEIEITIPQINDKTYHYTF